MVQLQALNDMLNNNNIDQYIAQGITKKYFSEYYDEFNFIVNHYNTYNKVPDWETFLAKFNDFEVVEVLEPVKYIIYNLKEEYLFDQGVSDGGCGSVVANIVRQKQDDFSQQHWVCDISLTFSLFPFQDVIDNGSRIHTV